MSDTHIRLWDQNGRLAGVGSVVPTGHAWCYLFEPQHVFAGHFQQIPSHFTVEICKRKPT